MKGIYTQTVFNQISHILSFVDRNAASSTYGCFDRKYWSWRIGDMPNASLQYGIYPLTWLWKNDVSGRYRNNDSLLEWIVAAIRYWLKIQNKNGSVNQFFPNEQSVGTTYYTLSAVLFVYETLRERIDLSLKVEIEKAIAKASEFVLKRDETYAIISNHIALFAFVNLLLSSVLRDDRFKKKAWRQLEIIFAHQSEEGWFLEYDGADPGYQTQCTYYLAECYRLTGDKEILNRIQRSIGDFLVYFFHPDGSFGGEYGSRNTEIIYPAGFEMLKKEIPVCSQVTRFIHENLSRGNFVSLDSLDDENLIRLSSNYMIASQYEAIEFPDDSSLKLPCLQPIAERTFYNAGFVIKGNEKYYAIVNFNKGGIFKIFDKIKGELTYEDNGYFFQLNGIVITNQSMQNAVAQVESSSLSIKVDFYQVLDDMLTPGRNIILRLLAMTLFRCFAVTDLFRKLLVTKAFTGRKRYDLQLRRVIRFNEDGINIDDILSKVPLLHLRFQIIGRKLYAVKMASSNYHTLKDLQQNPVITFDLDELNRQNEVKVSKIISIGHVL